MRTLAYSVALCLLLAVFAVSAAPPAPTTLFTAAATPNNAALYATCPVTVVSNQSAFVCYRDAASPKITVQYVNPSNPSTNGVPSTFNSSANFVFPPIALSKLSAIAYTSDPVSSMYVQFSAFQADIAVKNRRGSVANVAYAPDLNTSFVPYGVANKTGWYDFITAFDVTAADEASSIRWTTTFNVPVGYPYTTRMSTPVYYNGFLYVATKDHFYQLNASTGKITKNVSNPCNLNLGEDQWLNFNVVTVGADSNGPLDAFILSANTSSSSGPQMTICRISHNSFTAHWQLQYDDEIRVDDITGAMDTIVVSGAMINSPTQMQYVVFTIGATSGVQSDTLLRTAQDRMSFPAALAQPVGGCQETLVLQVGGQLTAFCTSDLTTKIWQSPYSCTYRPTVDAASNSIVCTSMGSSIQRIDSDGSLIWYTSAVKAYFTASIVGGVVWVVDSHATVYGLSLAAYMPPPPPLPAIVLSASASHGTSTWMTTTSPLAVLDSHSAFVAYKNPGGNDTLQMLNPAAPGANGIAAKFASTDMFVFPPLPASPTVAVAFTALSQSSTYVSYSSTAGVVSSIDRKGSTAQVVFAPDLGLSFVPIGVTSGTTLHESLIAYTVNPTTGQSVQKWGVTVAVPAGYPYTTSMSSPVYYRGAIYVATRTRFIQYNASTGTMLAASTNPCGMNSTTPLTLTVVTYGYDSNGPLDAFIITGNTTDDSNGPQFSICRVSHLTGGKKWRIDYNDNVNVLDITGANNVLVISAQLTDLPSDVANIVFTVDATTGLHGTTLNRQLQDARSFPAVLIQPVGGCVQTIVFQLDGYLTAFCTETLDTPVWISSYGCTHRPTVNAPTNSIVCTSWNASIQHLDSDGQPIWYAPNVHAVFTAVVADGLIWAVDAHATVYGLSIPSANGSLTTIPPTTLPPTTTKAPATTTAAPTTPEPTQGQGGNAPSGISAGSATGIALGVILVVALALGGAFYYRTRIRRRRAYEANNTEGNYINTEGNYGSVISDAA